MDCGILFEKEQVTAYQFTGHGGLIKVEGMAQQYLADALNTAVPVMKTAGEGGSWGMALLAAYAVGIKGFADFMKLCNKELDAEKKSGDDTKICPP